MERSTNRKWLALAAVSSAVAATAIDNTVVNVALPSIQADLGLSRSGLEWIVNGYILAFAALLLTGGRLADAFGRKRLFLLGFAVFTGASLFGGFAGSEALLVAARVVQGAGAALMIPATLAIISHAFPEKERGKAISIWAAVGALGFAVGPAVGGLLTEHVDWSWIFWINLPVGLGGFLLGRFGIDESHDSTTGRSLDLAGLLLSGVGLLALTYALVEGNRYGWSSATIIGVFGAALVAFIAFTLLERHKTNPMLDLSLFRSRAFTGGNLVLILSGFGLFGVFFFLSLYLQGIVGLSPIQGGLAFAPIAAIIIVSAPLSAKLSEHVGTAPVVASGMVLLGTGLYVIAGAGEHAGYLAVLPGLLVAGLGSALTTPLTTAVIASVPAAKAGVSSGVLNTSRELAGSLGIAVMGAILAAREGSALDHGASPSAAFVSGYSHALTIGAAVMVAGALVAAVALPKRTRPLSLPRRRRLEETTA